MNPISKNFRKKLSWPHFLRKIQARLIAQKIKKNASIKVLDIGCAAGYLTHKLNAPAVIGADVASSVFRFRLTKTHRAIQCDAFHLPFKNNSFDSIVLSSILQMMESPLCVILEAKRVCKDGGNMVLTVPISYLFLPAIIQWAPIQWLLKRCSLPIAYPDLLNVILEKFNCSGAGFLSINAVRDYLNVAGLTQIAHEYCPKIVGSFLTEAIIVINLICRGTPSVSGIWPMLLYPFTFLDILFFRHSSGTEALFTARK